MITLLNTTYLASASGDTKIKIWNQATGALVTTISNNTRVVSCLAQLPTGDLASGAYDYLFKTYSSSSWSFAYSLTGHLAGINAILVLQSNLIATGSDDSTIIIWSLF